MKITFYYVRHGETVFNTLGRMQGACDSPLTDKGIRGAEDTASALRRVDFDACYSSSSERAWETAKILTKYHDGIEPVLMKGLREFDFGDLDGEKIERFRDEVFGTSMKEDWSAYGGESMEGFARRSGHAFDEIVRNAKDGDNVLIVSHGSYIMHLMTSLLHFDQKAYIERCNATHRRWMPNTGICIFIYEDGEWSLTEEPMSADEFRRKHHPHTVDFWFVRHGETQFNLMKRMQGQCDSPLTEEGIAQAQAVHEKLQEVGFARAWCSTSERARDTAEIILHGTGIQAVCDARLKEVFFGRLEGAHYEKMWDEMKERHMKEDWTDVGGEDREAVRERVRTFFRDAYDASEDGDQVLIVSHGNYYLNVLETLFEIDRASVYQKAAEEKRNPIPNGGICTFTNRNGYWKLNRMM